MHFNTENNEHSNTEIEVKEQRIAVPITSKQYVSSLAHTKSKMNELTKAYELELEVLFIEKVSVLFSAIPELESFEIIQYTPYFNDGDECKFSIHNVEFFDNTEYTESPNFVSTPQQKELKDNFEKFIFNNKNIMKTIYDDHAKITFTRELIEVEDYEHE